jgi:hypothetical protein
MTTVFFLVLFLWILVNIVPTRDPRVIHVVGLVCLIVLVVAMTGLIHVPEWRCEHAAGGRHCVFR